MQCPSCGSANPEGKKHCGNCAAALPQCCPACAAENPATNRYCGHCGAALATGARLGVPERRQVTVLICDLVGSTALSARLDPEDMREVIVAYHRCCAETIAGGGGFVANYLGDGVLAYFGYPQAHEDDAERAVRSALALIEAVPRLSARQGAPPQVRIGIATGVVVIGEELSAGDAKERTAVGETPNLAARLQALAEPGQIVISHNTRRLLGRLFEYRDLGRVTLKGFVEPVNAYQVLAISTLESRFDARHGAKLTPLVGREEELELLQRRWRQACSGEGRVVLVAGEPGIGKSRLTVALQERLQIEPHGELKFFCSPHHTDTALYPLISQLEHAAGFERTDGPAERLAKLKGVLPQASADAREDVSLLADLLSLPTEDHRRLSDMSPQKRKDKTLSAFLDQLQGLARQNPVLMVLEDAHWIDPTTRELLEMAIEQVANIPVLLVVTYRPEFEPPAIGQAHVTLLTLNRLDHRQRIALVERVVGENALSDEVAAEIAERADGIPLFVEELTKAVLESGDEREVRRMISVAPRPKLVVPATLQASLMARLDHLGPEAKEIAQIGAAVGREFSYELLAAVARRSDAELRRALDRFIDAGLMFRRGVAPEATFLFKHALVRDAAYGTLLRRQRQQLHGGIAAALEREFPTLVKSQPEMLAHHCAEALQTERAVELYLAAAKRAVAASSNSEAVGHLTKGLALVEMLPETAQRATELRLRFALSVPLIHLKGYGAPEVEAAFARCRELCADLGDGPELFHSLYGLWGYHLLRARLRDAMTLSTELLDLARRVEDSNLRLAAHHTATVTSYWRGQLAAVPAHSDEELALYDPDRQRGRRTIANDAVVDSLGHCAFALWALGYPDRARDKGAAATELARRINHPFSLCSAMNWNAYLHYFRREPERAGESLAVMSALAKEHGFAFWSAAVDIWEIWRELCIVRQGAPESIDRFRRAHGQLRVLGAELAYPPYIPMLIDCLAAQGRLEEALDALADGLADVERTGEAVLEPQLLCLKGDMLRRQQGGAALDHAETAYRRAADIAKRQGARMWELRAATALAGLWREQGARRQARDMLAPVYGWFTEGFETRDLHEAKAILDAVS